MYACSWIMILDCWHLGLLFFVIGAVSCLRGSAGRGSNWSDGSPLACVCSTSRVILFILLSATTSHRFIFFKVYLLYNSCILLGSCAILIPVRRNCYLLFVILGPLYIGAPSLWLSPLATYLKATDARFVHCILFFISHKIYAKRGENERQSSLIIQNGVWPVICLLNFLFRLDLHLRRLSNAFGTILITWVARAQFSILLSSLRSGNKNTISFYKTETPTSINVRLYHNKDPVYGVTNLYLSPDSYTCAHNSM